MAVTGLHDLFMYGIHIKGASSFPGLGTLRVKRYPASYSVNRNYIQPPSTSLDLSSEYSAVNDIRIYAASMGIPDDILETWLQPLQFFLQDKDHSEKQIYDITGLGHIICANGILLWENTKDAPNFNAFRNWSPLPVKPLPLNPQMLDFAVENPKELIFEGKKEIKKPSKYLIPLAILSVIIMFLIFKISTDDHVSENAIRVERNVTGKINSLIITNVMADEKSSEKNDTVKKVSTPSETLNSITSSQADSKSQPTENKSTKKSEISAAKHQCIYVTGSFTVRDNAIKLEKKLKKQGYTVTITPNDNFHRVGVIFDCTSTESEKFKALQNKFPELWLLEE